MAYTGLILKSSLLIIPKTSLSTIILIIGLEILSVSGIVAEANLVVPNPFADSGPIKSNP